MYIRDLSTYNIMMDGTSLYPDGFHPDRHNRSKSAQTIIRGRYRLHSAPVLYYFIDFGFSSKYEGEGPWLAWGTHGQDRDAPELKIRGGHQYDPFALDIFTLGNAFRKSFVQVSACPAPLPDLACLSIVSPRRSIEISISWTRS